MIAHCANQFGRTDLLTEECHPILFLILVNFSRDFPVLFIDGFVIRLEFVHLEEVEAAELILDEVTHEVVQRALTPRVDIHLTEELVDGVDSVDGLWVRVRHALNHDGRI